MPPSLHEYGDLSSPTMSTLSFLDLPPEVRMMIYSYFGSVPKVSRSDFDGRRKASEIAKTRFHLQFVSRAIKLDFAPTFWRNLTLNVHGTIRNGSKLGHN